MSTHTVLGTSNTDEKPPAGTPCSPCKALGHYCAAAKYIGTTDDGICAPCATMKDCGRVLTVADKGEGLLASLPKKLDGCQAPGCKRKAAPGGSYCATDHYNELVAERKQRKPAPAVVQKMRELIKETPDVFATPSLRESYDVVIRDLEEKLLVLQSTIAALKALRKENACSSS